MVFNRSVPGYAPSHTHTTHGKPPSRSYRDLAGASTGLGG
uniref:Uncharacterized protein n=1 Tax=Anopheles albimanus TaxID=7167 RepID=A0A182FXG8_ANOAL